MEPLNLEIEDVLDLHTFLPAEIPALLDDYILACIGKRFFSVRIVHGKGKGFLKARVEKILKKHPLVETFKTAPPNAGGWGATLVTLKKKILVVDNEDDQREIMKRLIERLGYVVSVAADAQEAMGLVEEDDFSLIILDLIMPETDGLELCQQIKASKPGVLIYAFSGHIQLYDADKMGRAGFDGAISKPISLRDVERKMAEIFS